MPSFIRRLGVVSGLLGAVVCVFFGASTWWHQGQREDQVVWSQVQHETAWLVAILEPDSEAPNPPCAESLKLAAMGGNVTSGDTAQGESLMRAAQSRLLREGWSLSRREKLDIGDGLGARQRDSFERTISGRTVTISFVGSEQTDRPAGVYRPPPEPPGVMITMEPKFCGI